MNRPAVADHESRIVYSTRLDDNLFETGGLTVDILLSQWPMICNGDFGPGTSGYSFEAPENVNNHGYHPSHMPVRVILNCFPRARAIIKHACGRCRCTSCRVEEFNLGEKYQIESKPGCLAYLAEDHLCLIVAHAVADGFGIPDASNLRDFSGIRRGVRKLLYEVLFDGRIAWNTWFSLAACTYLGCQWIEKTVDAEEAAELVAIQHGSEVVVAPWVDLHSKLESQGSFGCIVATGQLCDMETDFGVLYTEKTSPPAGTISDWKLPESRPTIANISKISIQATITATARRGNIFKLTTIVKAGDWLRIINPATVFNAFGRSWTSECHDLFHGAPAQSHQMWSVEDVLGLWDKQDNGIPSDPFPLAQPCIIVDKSTRYISGSKNVRLNIFMALSPDGCVLKPNDCCLTCATARERLHSPWNRRIICVM
jgi:hypothetical protein